MDQEDLRKEEEAREQFMTAFDEFVKSDGRFKNAMEHDYASHMSTLALGLRAKFGEYEADRQELEDEWLEDLRQHKGEYDPKTLAKMHPKRSKAFLSLTRTKVQTISARMTDLLFPANKEKNWGIIPTPIPELNPAIIENLIAQYSEQTGEIPEEDFIRKELNKEARKRCEAMEKEMEDQLAELQYRYIVRSVIKDGHIYGTGVLKGPLVKEQLSKRWLPGPEGDWVTVELRKLYPWCEHVSIWDFYPDMSARTPDNMRGVFQRHVMSRQKVIELANRSDFNGDAIKSYLKVYKKGDANYKNWEQNLRTLNRAGSEKEASHNPSRHSKYELLEYWGFISTDELAEIGVEVDEDSMGLEVAANIWLLGPMVVKAVISGVEGVTLPYHLYYYEKDDTSIFGEGLPRIMRDAQKLFNASVRAMLDNAAISAGPIIEANMDLLDASEDPRDVYPFRVFVREGVGMDAAAQAIRVYKIPSYTNQFMQMIQFFLNAADEVTAVPRYMYGDTNKIGGAGKTATGLSMLMGAANVTLKDQVKNYDDGITKPFIKALYFWNMEFNPKEHIKGDFNVRARGSTSLIAREVRMEALNQFLAMTSNPIDLMYTKRWNVLKEAVKAMDLDDLDLIKDENQIAIEEKQRAAAEAEERQFMRDLAMAKAQSGGHMGPGASTPGMRPDMKELSPEQLGRGEIPEVTTSGGEPINPA